MAHPRPYQSEYDAKYQEHMAGVPLPAEKKVAGQSSMETLVAREPAFTHKRRVELANVRKDQVAHAVDFTGQRMDVENPALRYKTGVRRSTDRWPTEYKLQYGWKAPEASAPLLQAQEALNHHHHQDHHPACPKKPVGQGNRDDQDSQDDPGDSVRSIDDSDNSDQELVPAAADPTNKRVTTAATKQRQTSKQKTATRQPNKQPARVPPLNMTKAKRTAPVKTRKRPKIPTMQKLQEEEAGSDSDTDSQTGQKPQKRSTSSHYKCGHKKKKKAKRKLIWPMTTEYQTQFKLREQPSVVDDENDQPPAGSPQKLADSSDPRLLKHSPLKLFKLQPERTKFTSEYLANFQAPTKLRYKEGAWCGASPPHLLPQQQVRTADNDDDGASSDTVTTVGDWFNQVLELRRMASSYRKRAEGTHFVQVHLADIEGIEDLEEATSTVSTCSICRLQQQPPPHPASRAPPTRSHDPQDNDNGDDTESITSSPTISSATHENIVQPTAPKQPQNDQEHSDHEDTLGRLPTPELKKIPPERKIRHHLDRTTPCKGAILTSPPKEVRHGWNPEEMSEIDEDDENPLTQSEIPPGVTKTLPRYRRDMTSHAPIYPSHNSTLTVPHSAPQHTTRPARRPENTGTKKSRTFKQSQRSIQTQTRPAPNSKSAMPSRRVRPTDGGNEDLECSYCGSPLRQPPTTAHRKSRLITDNRQLAAHKSSTTTTRPTRAPVNLPQQPRTANLPLGHHQKQHQLMSGSLLSLSSCSVASEVLERAQRRKETFWNQRETTAT